MSFPVRVHPFAAATVAAIIHLRRRHNHIKAMGPTLLVLSAKSHEELKHAHSLKLKSETNDALNLSEEEKEVKVLLESEVGSTDQLNFEVRLYMGSLVASRFGRLLIWSPRLSSTHDLVSKNFHDLPCGTVCLTYVQFKGRGVGLNVDNQEPTTCLNVALEKMRPNSSKLTRDQILASFFNKFELLKIFLKEGFNVLEDLYCKTWLHSDQKVVIEEKIDGRSIQAQVTVKGLTSSGYLLATDKQNKFYELHPDGNSFDFFKGLARRKL